MVRFKYVVASALNQNMKSVKGSGICQRGTLTSRLPPPHASRTPWCLSSYDHKRGSDTVFPTGKERTGRELLHIRSGSAAAADDRTPICQILPPGKKKKRIIIESRRAASEEDLISRLLLSPQWLWGQGQPWSPPCAAPFKGRCIQ